MDWHQLEKMKVTDLRDLAKEKTKIEGVVGMDKPALVELLAQEMGIEKPHKVAGWSKKGEIKAEIRGLKEVRQKAIESKDKELLRRTRHKIHRLRRQLRTHAKLAG